MRFKYGWSSAKINTNIRQRHLRKKNITVCALIEVNVQALIKHPMGSFYNIMFSQFISCAYFNGHGIRIQLFCIMLGSARLGLSAKPAAS
jgi:hypothetical protein